MTFLALALAMLAAPGAAAPAVTTPLAHDAGPQLAAVRTARRGATIAKRVPRTRTSPRLPATSLGPRWLPPPARAGAGQPALAIAPDGGVWMSWFEPRPSGGSFLRVATLRGRSWSAARTVAEGDSFVVNWADVPALHAAGEGRLAIAWPHRARGGESAVELRVSQSFDGGVTWSRPVVPHRDRTPNEHGFAAVVAEGERTRVVWLDGRNAARAPRPDDAEEGAFDMTVRTALVDRDGNVTEEKELDGRACDCCPTAAVATSAGTVVAWRDRSPEEIRDIVVARMNGHGWTSAQAIHRDGWKVPGCPVNGPALDAEVDRVAAAWYTEAADSARAYVAFSWDGGRIFGRPVRVDEGEPIGRVAVALLEENAGVVSWLEGTGKSTRLLARRVIPGRAGAATTVAHVTGPRASGYPRMVRSGDRLVLAWTEGTRPTRLRVAELAFPPAP